MVEVESGSTSRDNGEMRGRKGFRRESERWLSYLRTEVIGMSFQLEVVHRFLKGLQKILEARRTDVLWITCKSGADIRDSDFAECGRLCDITTAESSRFGKLGSTNQPHSIRNRQLPHASKCKISFLELESTCQPRIGPKTQRSGESFGKLIYLQTGQCHHSHNTIIIVKSNGRTGGWVDFLSRWTMTLAAAY